MLISSFQVGQVRLSPSLIIQRARLNGSGSTQECTYRQTFKWWTMAVVCA
jgi:hypothetical protein